MYFVYEGPCKYSMNLCMYDCVCMCECVFVCACVLPTAWAVNKFFKLVSAMVVSIILISAYFDSI